MADARSLLRPVRPDAPGELGGGEQELLVEIVGGRDDHPGGAAAPLHAHLVVPSDEPAALSCRPVGEPVLDDGSAREHVVGLAHQRLASIRCEEVAAAQERVRVAGRPVRSAEAPIGHAPQPLRPEPVGIACRPEGVRALAPRLAPSLLAGPVGHRARGVHRPGDAPHHLVRLVADVLPDAREQVVRDLRVRREAPGNGEDAGLAPEQGRLRPARQLVAGDEVGLTTPRGERARRGVGQVELRLRVAAPLQDVERPDDAGRADVEILQRQRRLPAVPLVRRPQLVAAVRGVGVRDDLADRCADAPLVPRLVRQRLECLRPVEHGM